MILDKIKAILLATQNKGKIAEFENAFADFPLKWFGLSDFPPVDAEETGETFLDNALIKAMAGHRISGLPTIADDSGLIIDAMGNYPGVKSARIGGEALTDRQRCDYLIAQMKERGVGEGASAYFASTILLVVNENEIYWSEGKVKGTITFSPKGENGFGYDPIFYLPEYGKTMAELPLGKKNEISHRGKAIKAFHDGNYQGMKFNGHDKSP